MKVLFDISNSVLPGLYIGNQRDGVSWLNFRFENFPLFCFNCGIIGHGEDTCDMEGLKAENIGGDRINQRGAWLRSKT